MSRYRVTHVAHYIGGRLVQPGEIVSLPADTQPGRWLVPVEGAVAGAAVQPALIPESTAPFKVVHVPPGNYAVVRSSDGARVSRVYKRAEGNAKALAEEELIRLEQGGNFEVHVTDELPDA